MSSSFNDKVVIKEGDITVSDNEHDLRIVIFERLYKLLENHGRMWLS